MSITCDPTYVTRDGCWTLCEQCGIPAVLHRDLWFDTDDGSTRPAVCVIERYLPLIFHPGERLTEVMQCPILAFIAAFEYADIHKSIRFRDEAEHLAEWAASPGVMSPGDVDEAKRYDRVSELLTHSIEAAHDVDAVASCRCLGCVRTASSADAIAVSARPLVEQAEAEAARCARRERLASDKTHWAIDIGTRRISGHLPMRWSDACRMFLWHDDEGLQS